MSTIPVTEILVGIYLGLLAAIFPSFVAFLIGFVFKYFTSVTVPGLGVVALGGALAGVSGGLMGLIDPTLAESWTGITAVLVILMACLWAHSQGDKLGEATPRHLTLKTLREARLSTDIADRVDSFGQIRIRPIGEIEAIDGYPPLSAEVRERLSGDSWKFRVDLPISELEARLEERLRTEYELVEASVSIDAQGRAQIAVAPMIAGLSRRVPPGKRAVSIRTVLPTGVARGDVATLHLPEDTVTGTVVSARSADAVDTSNQPIGNVTEPPEDAADTDVEFESTPTASTTTGGEGYVTLLCSQADARAVIRAEFAPMVIHSRGKQREYEAIGVLKADGNRFRKLTIGADSNLVGAAIGDIQIRDTYDVAILALRRPLERVLCPDGSTTLQAGDVVHVVGKPDSLRTFEEVTA
ncbi:TrkA C-terminal domain-containing protein [Halobacteria archaeon AArc-curdl1]|uniref:TrkA C-terminal domain-containing protein n=1 Tax=Natronosalvus hydrolyticus TaxID=2979988 RepID=A0AAP2ZBH4_9EURY|nr:TrkA C-terminal domain-containing protein [Halobacteria archaeon AArc-curdl1]